jgi:hypothetical protein
MAADPDHDETVSASEFRTPAGVRSVPIDYEEPDRVHDGAGRPAKQTPQSRLI